MSGWKVANPLAIKISLICGVAFLIFLAFIFKDDKTINEDILKPIVVAHTIACFILPWLMTHMGAQILKGSSGAIRLAVATSIAWLIIDYLFIYKPDEKYGKDTTGLLIYATPLFIFWVTIWITKGFNHDQNTNNLHDKNEHPVTQSNNTRQKKRIPKNALDELIFVAYGNPPPPKTAVLYDAINIAHEELLMKLISFEDVYKVGKELYDSPIPYSTHDLALSIALNFFSDTELMPTLEEAQLFARAKMLEWLSENRINPMMTKSFEEKLYRLYKPTRT